eukprot:scaffold30427_cov139-Isochrysis_galbana.AAC.2
MPRPSGSPRRWWRRRWGAGCIATGRGAGRCASAPAHCCRLRRRRASSGRAGRRRIATRQPHREARSRLRRVRRRACHRPLGKPPADGRARRAGAAPSAHPAAPRQCSGQAAPAWPGRRKEGASGASCVAGRRPPRRGRTPLTGSDSVLRGPSRAAGRMKPCGASRNSRTLPPSFAHAPRSSPSPLPAAPPTGPCTPMHRGTQMAYTSARNGAQLSTAGCRPAGSMPAPRQMAPRLAAVKMAESRRPSRNRRSSNGEGLGLLGRVLRSVAPRSSLPRSPFVALAAPCARGEAPAGVVVAGLVNAESPAGGSAYWDMDLATLTRVSAVSRSRLGSASRPASGLAVAAHVRAHRLDERATARLPARHEELVEGSERGGLDEIVARQGGGKRQQQIREPELSQHCIARVSGHRWNVVALTQRVHHLSEA